jgi:hypothetical protein
MAAGEDKPAEATDLASIFSKAKGMSKPWEFYEGVEKQMKEDWKSIVDKIIEGGKKEDLVVM